MNHEAKVKILRILYKYDTAWTGRELAKEVSVSPTTAHKLLKALVNEDVVEVSSIGRSYAYKLNNKNYVVKNLLRPFFEKEKDILNVVISLIKNALLKSKVKLISAAIFGSIAQRADTERSDIDLLIILDNLKSKDRVRDKIDKISNTVAQNFHTAISPLILSAGQFIKKYKEKTPLIREILKSYILIMGKPLERVII